MSTRSPSTPSLAPSGLGRGSRHVPIRGAARGESGDATGRRRDLEIAVATVVGMAAVVSGPLIWAGALLVLAATILGTLQLLAEVDGPDADRGVPVESLIVPAVAALGAVGAIRLVPLGPAIIPAIAGVGILLDRALAIEERIVGAAQGPTADDRSASLVVILVVALVAFAGVAAGVPGGLAGTQPAGSPVTPLSLPNLLVLALADAVGALGTPRRIGPALLMFLFYLWDTLHAAPPSRRRDPRWLWETAILLGLAIAVIAWNLRREG